MTWQLSLAKGCDSRRLIFWPRWGHISIRLIGYWWLGLSWQGLSPGAARVVDALFPGWCHFNRDGTKRLWIAGEIERYWKAARK